MPMVDVVNGETPYSSFNGFSLERGLHVNCIVRNMFLGVKFEDDDSSETKTLGKYLPLCRYIVGTSKGLYGL